MVLAENGHGPSVRLADHGTAPLLRGGSGNRAASEAAKMGSTPIPAAFRTRPTWPIDGHRPIWPKVAGEKPAPR